MTLATMHGVDPQQVRDLRGQRPFGLDVLVGLSFVLLYAVMSIATAMIGTRSVTAAAVRLDPPVPTWWAEVAAFDIRTPLVHSIEYEAWATRERAERYPVGESDGSRFEDVVRRAVAPLARPIRVAQASIAIARFHETAGVAAKSDPCEPLVIASNPDWAAFIRRFHRFEIEREGADKFLTRKFSTDSQCKSGRWTYDGATLAFHGALPPATSRVTIIPLRYQTGERASRPQ